MAVVTVEELAKEVPGRLLGIDVGSRTLGLALSDLTRTIATPLLTLRRRRFREDAAALVAVIGEHEVLGLVIGLPISMDGREGPRCQSVRQFAANLAAHVPLPMAFWDERWSTVAVERMLVGEADLSRKRRREVVDKSAACYILQGALDFLAARRGRTS